MAQTQGHATSKRVCTRRDGLNTAKWQYTKFLICNCEHISISLSHQSAGISTRDVQNLVQIHPCVLIPKGFLKISYTLYKQKT